MLSILGSPRPRRRVPARARPPRQARPQLEALDRRDVPATFYVTTGSDSGPGSLRDAINQNNTGPNMNTPNEIIIQSGVTTISLMSTLSVTNSASLSIHTANPAGPNVIIAPAPFLPHYQFRFLTAGLGNQGTFSLTNLTIWHFGTTGDGGAILHQGLLLELDHCALVDNRANGNGGAVADTGLDLTIKDHCYFGAGAGFSGNVAGTSGGAVWFFPNGGDRRLLVQDSDFGQWALGDPGDNTWEGGSQAGLDGGAIWSRTTYSTEIYNCHIMRNVAAQYGGGVYAELGLLTITNPPSDPPGEQGAWIGGNSAGTAGGGVYAHECTSVDIEADVYGNSGYLGGGDDVWIAAAWQWTVDQTYHLVVYLNVS
jgi:hypothetical protein